MDDEYEQNAAKKQTMNDEHTNIAAKITAI